ncbi:MAG: hypothetical protein ACRDJO_00450 [Actinomycetota bacterium]
MGRGTKLALGSALATIGAAGLIWTGVASQADGATRKANDPAARRTGGPADGAVEARHETEPMIEACVEMMRRGMPGMMGRSTAGPGATP